LRPSAGRKRPEAGRQDALRFENVVQDRGTDGELGDLRLILRRHRVHTDEAEASIAVRTLAQEVAQDRE
jgi:hypothetical protein